MRLIDADELKTAFPCGERVTTESVRATIDHISTVDLSECCEKLWKAAYERGKAEARVIKLTETDKESLRKAMENAELTLLPAEKKGKWIKGIDVPNRKPYVHLADALYCSVCHEEAYWDTDDGQQLFAYCPNCGARMEESE